jgi:predicted TIM-barrel fold metal-dependent hydrolase
MTAERRVKIIIQPLDFYDCNGMVGARRQVMHPGSHYDSGEYIRKMEHYGIARGLVCHAVAVENEPMEGNLALTKLIKNYPNLRPVFAALPHHTGEFPEPDAFRVFLKENNAAAVTILPRSYLHGTEDWVCGGLLSMLSECRVPLIAALGEITYADVHRFLTGCPRLRLILTNLHYNCARNLYPLLGKFENLYIETIGFKVHGGIEDVCEKFGAGRLVFGTNAPLYAGSGAVGMITYAPVTREEKQMIASGNLERILGGIEL